MCNAEREDSAEAANWRFLAASLSLGVGGTLTASRSAKKIPRSVLARTDTERCQERSLARDSLASVRSLFPSMVPDLIPDTNIGVAEGLVLIAADSSCLDLNSFLGISFFTSLLVGQVGRGWVRNFGPFCQIVF